MTNPANAGPFGRPIPISLPVPAPSDPAGRSSARAVPRSAARTAPRSAKPSSSRRSTSPARCWRSPPTTGSASCRLPTRARVEMALWSLLGARPVDVLAWESFGLGWVTDVVKQLKLKDARTLKADYGKLPDLAAGRLRARRGLHLERHHLGRARARTATGSPPTAQGLTICDATSAAFAQALRLRQARRRHLLLAEGARRRGGARHDRAHRRAPWRGWRATRRRGRCRRSSA